MWFKMIRNGIKLPDNVLETFILQKLQSNNFSEEIFIWQGGEPTLLGIEYFQKIVKLQQNHANGKEIKNSLQTNGIILTLDRNVNK